MRRASATCSARCCCRFSPVISAMRTSRRCAVTPPLLGMRKVVSEDAVRRGLAKIDETAGMDWLQTHLDYCMSPLLQEPWVLDVDTTIKPLYGTQEGAVVEHFRCGLNHVGDSETGASCDP